MSDKEKYWKCYDCGEDVNPYFKVHRNGEVKWHCSKCDSTNIRPKMKKDKGIKPEDWEREGWIAVCSKHLSSFKEEGDGYAPVGQDSDEICIMEGCNNKATYEIYPNLKEAVKEVKEGKTKPLEEVKGDSFDGCG